MVRPGIWGAWRAMPASERKIYGMVHLQPLPGTPFYAPGSFERTLEAAVRAAQVLASGGADGCLVQTVDRVYDALDESDPARTAAMSLIVSSIVQQVGAGFVTGVQMMRNAIKPSLAVAKVSGATFIRATALVGTTPSDAGPIHGDPYDVMMYRRHIDAADVAVIADIASLHHTPARAIGDLARHALRVGAAAVAVGSPEEAQTLEWIAEIRRAAPGLPIFISGHTHHENVARIVVHADGVFVGSCIESGGFGGEIDQARVASYVKAVRDLPVTRGAAQRGAR